MRKSNRGPHNDALLLTMRIPVIAATQSGAKLPLIPAEGCHPIRSKAATHSGSKLPPQSERSDATLSMDNLKSS